MKKTLPEIMRSSVFIGAQLLALSVLFVPFTWWAIPLCFALYIIRMFAITGGYHRYFSHRSYKTGRTFQFILAFLGSTAMQKGALWWAAEHRHHHRHSDQPEDIHSPVQKGFWWSHMGWIINRPSDHADYALVKDLSQYPELRFLNRFYLLPPLSLALALLLIGGPTALAWGFFMSTTLVWHGTFTINSLSHVFGSKRYATTDESRNNFWLALITLGEGWHNNHHAYQASCRQGFFWWEIDITYGILLTLQKLGIVWDLKAPPLEKLEARRIDRLGQTTTKAPSKAPLPAVASVRVGTPIEAKAAH